MPKFLINSAPLFLHLIHYENYPSIKNRYIWMMEIEENTGR